MTEDANLSINNLLLNLINLKYHKSKISLHSHLQNISDSIDYNISINFNKSTIYKNDIYPILLNFTKSKLPTFNKLLVDKFKINLNKDSISTNLNLRSDIGNIAGAAKFDFNLFSYNGNLRSEKLNIGAIINNKSINSSLNSNIIFQGNGSNINNLNFDLVTKIHNSKIASFDFNKLIFKARSNSSGKIKIDSLLIIINPVKKGYENNQSRLFLTGSLDYTNAGSPQYYIESKFHRINTAKLFNNNNLPDLINGGFQLRGLGFEPDSIIADLKINLSKMQILGNTIYPKKLTCSIARDNKNNKEIRINSNFFNADIKGNFNYLSLLFNDLI